MPTTILIIDDEPRVLRAFARNVRMLGYTVITADGGRVGLEMYHREQPEVVITDLRMPEMTGLEVLAAIRAHDPEANVILTSGHGNQDAILAAVRAGAADFLPKPVDHVLLENALQRAEERVRLQRELRASQAALREQNAQLEATVAARTAELEETLEKYRVLFESFPLGITVADSAGEILEINQQSEQLLGLPQAEHATRHIAGEEWRIIRPDGSPMPAEEYASVRALQEGRLIRNVEMGIVKPDAVTWINVTAAPLQDDRVVITYNDVTERQRAEIALRESEAKLRALTNATEQSFVLLDRDGVVLACNRVAQTNTQAVFGVAIQPGDAIERFVLDRDRTEFAADFARALNGDIVHTERPFPLADGTTRWFAFTYHPVVEGEQVVGVGFNTIDITERQRAEIALRESESRFRSLFENSPIAYQSLNEAGQYIDVNPRLCELLGYSRDELLGKVFGEFWSERTQHRFPEAFEGFKCSGAVSGELELVRKDGSRLTVVLEGKTQRDHNGDFVRTHCILHNITARKQMEDALRESEARYKKAQRLGNVGNWEYNVQTTRFWGSDEAKRIYGFDPAAEDFSVDEVERCIPERERVHQALLDLIAEDAEYDLEFEIHPGNSDQTKTIVSIAELERDADGNPLKVTGVVQDITDRKQAEAAREESLSRYDELVKSIPVGVYVAWLRADGTMEFGYVSDRWCEIHQVQREAMLADASTVNSLVHPDEQAAFWARNQEAIRTHQPFLWEGRFIVGDDIRWLRIESTCTVMDNGDTRWFGVTQDITTRKQMEEALRESERRHRELAANIPGAVYQFRIGPDDTFSVPYMSAGGAEVFERPLADLMSDVPVFDDIHPDDREAFLESIDHATQTMQRWTHEFRTITPTGKAKWLRGSSNPRRLPDGSLLWDGVLLDITERKRAEEALQQHNRRLAELNAIVRSLASTLALEEVLARILQAIPYFFDQELTASIQLLDEQGNLRHRAASDDPLAEKQGPILHPGEGIAGRVIQERHPINVPDMTTDARYVSRPFPSSHRSLLIVPLIAHDQILGALSLTAAPVGAFDDQDTELLRGLAGYAAIAVYNAQLYEQARRDAETKALLLHEVNHRVKNNLDGILGMLYIERRHAPPETLPAYGPIIEDLTQRIAGLAQVHQMLSEQAWAPLNLSQLAETIIQTSLQNALDDVTFTLDITPTAITVEPAPAHHLALILSELATNTLKYAVAGRDAVHIKVQITQKDGTIILTYRNDGPDFPEDVLDLDRHSAGLDIIKRTVRKSLQGKITLRNTPQGAETEIRFKADSKARGIEER
ncbi:MAG: PAS domain S-box protein [Anaerolineales bacterium]